MWTRGLTPYIYMAYKLAGRHMKAQKKGLRSWRVCTPSILLFSSCRVLQTNKGGARRREYECFEYVRTTHNKGDFQCSSCAYCSRSKVRSQCSITTITDLTTIRRGRSILQCHLRTWHGIQISYKSQTIKICTYWQFESGRRNKMKARKRTSQLSARLFRHAWKLQWRGHRERGIRLMKIGNMACIEWWHDGVFMSGLVQFSVYAPLQLAWRNPKMEGNDGEWNYFCGD